MGKKSQKKNKMKKDNANKGTGKIKKFVAKPQSVEELSTIFKVQAHDIKNKMKRVEVHAKRKLIRNQLKLK